MAGLQATHSQSSPGRQRHSTLPAAAAESSISILRSYLARSADTRPGPHSFPLSLPAPPPPAIPLSIVLVLTISQQLWRHMSDCAKGACVDALLLSGHDAGKAKVCRIRIKDQGSRIKVMIWMSREQAAEG